MIASSTRAKFVALGVAALAHAAFALAVPGDPEVLTEGGQAAQEAQIGTSFTDMSAGTQTAEAATETVGPVAPDPAEPVQRMAAAPVPAEQAQTAPRPDRPAVQIPEVPDASVPLPPTPLASDAPQQPEVLAPQAATPDRAEPVEEPMVKPVDEPTKAETAEPSETAETIAATEPENTSVGTSLRPRMRDPSAARQAEAEQAQAERAEAVQASEPAPKPAPEPKAREGGARQDATRGAATGQQTATGTRQGDGASRAATPGNAAASNYPGLVNRHLSRVRKPSMNRRGAALVSFSITDSGGLGSLSVRRSSGARAMDDAALSVIQRAAPFPRPPTGAQRSFSIQIEFR